MKNFAIVENGIVVNVIIADDEFVALYREQNPTQLCVEYVESHINDENVARIGEHYVDGKFITPYVAPSVPTSITMRQTRLALLQAGKLSAIDTALASLPSPQKEQAQIEWEYASEVQRDNPLIGQLMSVLGMGETELDALFIEGAKL